MPNIPPAAGQAALALVLLSTSSDSLTLPLCCDSVLAGQEAAIPDEEEQAKMEESEAAPPGFCVECKEKVARLKCDQCTDEYCNVCFQVRDAIFPLLASSSRGLRQRGNRSSGGM